MVLAACVQKWDDFGIILFMLVVNGLVGFYEELKARASVNALKTNIISSYSCKRDGSFKSVQGPLLVPGDVVFLKAGDVIPADCHFLEGQSLQVSRQLNIMAAFQRSSIVLGATQASVMKAPSTQSSLSDLIGVTSSFTGGHLRPDR